MSGQPSAIHIAGGRERHTNHLPLYGDEFLKDVLQRIRVLRRVVRLTDAIPLIYSDRSPPSSSPVHTFSLFRFSFPPTPPIPAPRTSHHSFTFPIATMGALTNPIPNPGHPLRTVHWHITGYLLPPHLTSWEQLPPRRLKAGEIIEFLLSLLVCLLYSVSPRVAVASLGRSQSSVLLRSRPEGSCERSQLFAPGEGKSGLLLLSIRVSSVFSSAMFRCLFIAKESSRRTGRMRVGQRGPPQRKAYPECRRRGNMGGREKRRGTVDKRARRRVAKAKCRCEHKRRMVCRNSCNDPSPEKLNSSLGS
ncbi:hypothetical protein HNY73_015935 [Argiope bruennichi]|uniref:Uncharacterized protein n=1 Tax=Argiope bruennichi TaxID=94029 RepID=A0A8T0EHC6_ARGBR|nr:hypothetical protein HNY73_015935 [Argiope bruennichi]